MNNHNYNRQPTIDELEQRALDSLEYSRSRRQSANDRLIGRLARSKVCRTIGTVAAAAAMAFSTLYVAHQALKPEDRRYEQEVEKNSETADQIQKNNSDPGIIGDGILTGQEALQRELSTNNSVEQ